LEREPGGWLISGMRFVDHARSLILLVLNVTL
jgi:hypothetical protein